jgi:hypothetical protein
MAVQTALTKPSTCFTNYANLKSNQQEIPMRKVFLSVAALALLSTASFADQNTENAKRMDELRRQYFAMTMMMMDNQMAMMKKQQEMLTNFQETLRQAMSNDMGGMR